ncbi:MAG: hypothetical protein QM760_02370 [Nibricoccus sp.]
MAAIAACSNGEEAASSEEDIRTVERVIVGAAKPYSPDRTLDSKIRLARQVAEGATRSGVEGDCEGAEGQAPRRRRHRFR